VADDEAEREGGFPPVGNFRTAKSEAGENEENRIIHDSDIGAGSVDGFDVLADSESCVSGVDDHSIHHANNGTGTFVELHQVEKSPVIDRGAFDADEWGDEQMPPNTPSQMPPKHPVDFIALSESAQPNAPTNFDLEALWGDTSKSAVAFDAGEWGGDELWRLEKKGKGTYRYVLRFVRSKITRYGGTITPAIEEQLEQRKGKGRWQGSRDDARRLKCFAEYLAAELGTGAEGGTSTYSEADATGDTPIIIRGDSVRGVPGVADREVPDLRGGFIN
jgi:hypothetical protein